MITPSARYVLTNNIEAPRLEQEEKLAAQGWEIVASPWHEGLNLLLDLVGSMRLAAEKRGVQAIVRLVATDERVFAYRHPLPTAKKMERYAMLVLYGRKWGLVCSMTRLVHFGPLPPEVRRKAQAVAVVDAHMIQTTRPGVTLAEVFDQAIQAYGQVGYPGEWKLHHQGGAAGYEPREIVATPASNEVVLLDQVYAWNPSITGVKSEDTILIGEQVNEILTAIPGWPEQEIDLNGQQISRPAVLEIT